MRLRPEGYEDTIFRNWRNCVAPEDIVICLGDMVFDSKYWEEFDKLPGRKWLIRGNHDRKSYTWYLKHFEFVGDEFATTYHGIDILFTHEPKIFHEHDVNLHGHLHNMVIIDSPCLHFPLALEDMPYYGVYALQSIVDGAILQMLRKHKEEEKEEENYERRSQEP